MEPAIASSSHSSWRPAAWDTDAGEIAVLLRDGLQVEDYQLEVHPLSGRNRLCIARAMDGSQFFVKQSNLAGHVHLAAGKIGTNDFSVAPLAVSSSGRTAVYRYFPDAANLEEVAARDLDSTLRALLELGFRSMHFYSLEPSADLPGAASLVDYPFPTPAQVLDCSGGFRQILIEAQGRGLLERAAPAETPSLRLSHGDLKLDNILLLGARPALIDFELCCLAPVGSDTAGYVALMFVAGMRAGMFGLEGAAMASRLATPVRMAEGLWRGLKAYADLHSIDAPSPAEFDRMIARHLIERALTEAAPRRQMIDSDRLLLDLADLFLVRGLQGLSDALSPAR
jgi:hypothetical protein